MGAAASVAITNTVRSSLEWVDDLNVNLTFPDESIRMVCEERNLLTEINHPNWKFEYLKELRNSIYDISILNSDSHSDLVQMVIKEITNITLTSNMMSWLELIHHFLQNLLKDNKDVLPSVDVLDSIQKIFDRFSNQIECLKSSYHLLPEDDLPLKGETLEGFSKAGMTSIESTLEKKPGYQTIQEALQTLRDKGIRQFLSESQITMIHDYLKRTKGYDVLVIDSSIDLFYSNIFATIYGRWNASGVSPWISFILEQLIVIVCKVLPFYVKAEADILLLLQTQFPKIGNDSSTVDLREISSNIPRFYGVSLHFMKQFIKEHNITNPELTTGYIVEHYIIPLTAKDKESYINTFLLSNNNKNHQGENDSNGGGISQYFSDLRVKYRRKTHAWYTIDVQRYYHEGFYAFISHAWNMPFLQLMDIVEVAMIQYYQSTSIESTKENPLKHYDGFTSSQLEQTCFFWIDVFCKNQHKRSPSMTEFHEAIQSCNKVIVCLDSPSNPRPFQRIWCVYEIWTALFYKLQIIPTMPHHVYELISELPRSLFDSQRSKVRVPDYSTDHESAEYIAFTAEIKQQFETFIKPQFQIDIQQAKATMPEDITMILSLVQEHISLSEFNEHVLQTTIDLIWQAIVRDFGFKRYSSRAGVGSSACFDGEGQISLANNTRKSVKDLTIHDQVKTLSGEIARIELITKQMITEKEFPNGINMYGINNVWFTEFHPIAFPIVPWNQREEKKLNWKIAKEIPNILHERRNNFMLYNIELSPLSENMNNRKEDEWPSSVMINEVGVMTLGQTIGFDPISDELYGHGWKTNPIRMLYYHPSHNINED